MRVQLFLTGNHALKQPLDENDKFYVYVEQRLRLEIYSCLKLGSKLASNQSPQSTAVSTTSSSSTSAPFNIDFAAAAELFFYGDTLPLPYKEQELLHYFIQSTIELGELRFSNLSRFNSSATHVVSQLLRHLQPQLATFNDILDLYALSNENITRSKLFETF